MSMEDFLFGSDLEDSDEEEKATKPPKKSERDAQMNELFGDSPSEGEEEGEGGGARDSESDKEEEESGEEREERKNSVQEGEDDDNAYEWPGILLLLLASHQWYAKLLIGR